MEEALHATHHFKHLGGRNNVKSLAVLTSLMNKTKYVFHFPAKCIYLHSMMK
jgi:hypothetical protein